MDVVNNIWVSVETYGNNVIVLDFGLKNAVILRINVGEVWPIYEILYVLGTIVPDVLNVRISIIVINILVKVKRIDVGIVGVWVVLATTTYFHIWKAVLRHDIEEALGGDRIEAIGIEVGNCLLVAANLRIDAFVGMIDILVMAIAIRTIVDRRIEVPNVNGIVVWRHIRIWIEEIGNVPNYGLDAYDIVYVLIDWIVVGIDIGTTKADAIDIVGRADFWVAFRTYNIRKVAVGIRRNFRAFSVVVVVFAEGIDIVVVHILSRIYENKNVSNSRIDKIWIKRNSGNRTFSNNEKAKILEIVVARIVVFDGRTTNRRFKEKNVRKGIANVVSVDRKVDISTRIWIVGRTTGIVVNARNIDGDVRLHVFPYIDGIAIGIAYSQRMTLRSRKKKEEFKPKWIRDKGIEWKTVYRPWFVTLNTFSGQCPILERLLFC